MTELALITQTFENLGFEVLYYNKFKNANGPDMWVKRPNGRPLSVEIKPVRRMKNLTWSIPPVSEPRRNDDLIAVIFPGGKYVLIESMSDHLRACSKSGQRQMTLLFGG